MNKERDRGPWIQTYSGGKFFFLDPQPEDIQLGDIARSLSRICRFGGHTRRFYSVLEHSYHVAKLVPPHDVAWALLHDAPEAYIGDITTPLKGLLKDLPEIERKIELAIARKFSLTDCIPDSVKQADLIMLATEKRDLIAPADWGWELPPPCNIDVSYGAKTNWVALWVRSVEKALSINEDTK